MDDTTLGIQNLLLAAFLISGGARLSGIDSKSRFSTIQLDLETLDLHRLGKDLRALADNLSNEPLTNLDEWTWLFDSSVLGSVETNYHRLKKLVVSRREKS